TRGDAAGTHARDDELVQLERVRLRVDAPDRVVVDHPDRAKGRYDIRGILADGDLLLDLRPASTASCRDGRQPQDGRAQHDPAFHGSGAYGTAAGIGAHPRRSARRASYTAGVDPS